MPKEFFFLITDEQFLFSLGINTKENNILLLRLQTHLPERILAFSFYYVEWEGKGTALSVRYKIREVDGFILVLFHGDLQNTAEWSTNPTMLRIPTEANHKLHKWDN